MASAAVAALAPPPGLGAIAAAAAPPAPSHGVCCCPRARSSTAAQRGRQHGWHARAAAAAPAAAPRAAAARRPSRVLRVSAAKSEVAVVSVAEDTFAEEEEEALEQQQQQCEAADPGSVESLLHALHSLCDGSSGSTWSLATTQQLDAWAAAAQPHLSCMSLAEVSYVASCLRHHHSLCQQQQQQLGDAAAACASFLASPGFLQQACEAAHAAATAAQHALQTDDYYGYDSGGSSAAAAEHQELAVCLQHLVELLQWAAGEVVQQRQSLLQQLQAQQQGAAANAAAGVQAYRQQLQLQVAAQQQVQQLLQHPLVLAALPHAHCWQLQQLLVCSGQLGQPPSSDWMGRWLAAARHAASDLALPYLQQQDRWQLEHSHGPNWQLHVREHRASAASAYVQLVGLVSGLAAAHVKPPLSWTATWQQAAMAVLAAEPCFSALDDSGVGVHSPEGSDGSSTSNSHSAFFGMLQQLLQAVANTNVQLSAEFWTAHEGLVQQQLPGFSTAELLRLLQLHQRLNLRPSKACIKYMAAVLEQRLQQQWLAQQQQQQQAAGGASLDVLQLVMCTCGLSVWGVRLHLRSVAELLVCLQHHKEQLPLTVTLQALAVLGARLGRVYGLGWAAAAASTSADSSSSSDSSSDSSMSTLGADGEDPGAAVAAPTPAATAAAVEALLLHALSKVAASFAADSRGAAGVGSDASNSSSYSDVDCGPLLRLLQVCACLARNGSRASRSAQASTTDSVTTLAAAAAAAQADAAGMSSGVAFLDTVVHKLHPLCAAAACACTPQQLVQLMAAWNELGFSTAWRFGGFRRGFKRLGQQQMLQALSNAELAAAIEAVAKLPPLQSVVQALAAEVMHRQTQAQGEEAQEGTIDGQAAAAAAAPLSPAQLLTVLCAAPGLGSSWPAGTTLQLLQFMQGLVDDTLNPTQQWQLWNALQQLQRQWKPAVVAAAAAAAAAGNNPVGSPAATAAATATAGGSSSAPQQQAADMHPSVAFAAAAAAASLKAPVAASTSTAGMVRPRPLSAAATTTSGSSSGAVSTAPGPGPAQQQQLQQRLMRLVDELQDQVAVALARVQPDPDALPLQAAPPKVSRPLHAMQAGPEAAAADEGGATGPAPAAAAASGGATTAAEGQRTQQQALAAFAKAQRSLLNPHCSGAVLTKVVEGLVLLLAVPRYSRAARKNQTVQRAVLRALEAAAWPDLLAQAMDLQQLLLLTAAASALDARADGPYMQLLQQEVSRLLAEAPLRLVAADLGRLAALQQPLFRPDVCLLKFWVGRLAQAARQSPEDALAVLVSLTALAFKPAAGAAALVLQPLLAAAGQSVAAAAAAPEGSNSSGGTGSQQVSHTARLSPVGVLTLTRVLADLGLSPDAASTRQLLRAHVGLMTQFSVPQLLQLGRNVLGLGLLTTAAPPSQPGTAQGSSSSMQEDAAGGGSRSRLLQGAGQWAYVWLRNLAGRDAAQFDAGQVVELQLLLCELDLVPWHLARNRSDGIFATLQQLQARLAATPAAAAEWQPALAAAIQASYHSTQELRRLVAARARQLAHQQHGQKGRQTGAAGGSSTSSSSSSDGEAFSGTRRFVSRKAAAGGAAGSGGAAAAAAAGGFSYAANPVSQQLQQLTHHKRVLLWAAIKHQVVQPLTPAWVESCCFNVLVGNELVTPAVASGLLLAVAEVTRGSITPAASSSSGGGTAGAAAAASQTAELLMRESAFASLTVELVGRVLLGLQLLDGPLFVQALSSLSAAGVRAAATPAGSRRVAVGPLLGAAPAAAEEAPVPTFALSQRQCEQLLRDVARALPGLQPSQLPLLVTSMMQLQLQPDVAWLSEALQALAVKAAAAAAAGQPAQQLLLLAAAKQLLVCAGVLETQTAPAAASEARSAADAPSAQLTQPPAAAVRDSKRTSVVPAAMLPVAYALKTLAAGAVSVLGGVLRGLQQQEQQTAAPAKAAGVSNGAAASQAMAAAAAVAAAMTGAGDRSVALLLSSLATQLQLAQTGAPAAAGQDAAGTSALPLPAEATAAAAFRAMQAHIQRTQQEPGPTGTASLDSQQLLAAAVLLHAGSAAPVPAASAAAAAVGAARSSGAQGRVRFGFDEKEHRQQQARQQQQQRLLLGQLLQLQLQKASQQLVQSVWGASASTERQQVVASAADVYATQVLLDPTGDLMAPQQTQQQQEAMRSEDAQQQQQQRLQPHRLVTQGLQVQFDGLLRKAFMAAAAAAAGGARRGSTDGNSMPGADDENGSAAFAAAGGSSVDGGQQQQPREPWWLPRQPADVSGLLQAAPDGVASTPSSVAGAGKLQLAGVSGSREAAEGAAGSAAREQVVVLPVMSRALDAQFARLMREVLHSSLAAGSGGGTGGGRGGAAE